MPYCVAASPGTSACVGRRGVLSWTSTPRFADEVRAEIGDDEVVGLGFVGRLDRANPRRASDAVQHGIVAQFFGHSPTHAGDPERMALGGEQLFVIQ